ncbi:MAG: hypothetical protein ACJ74H_00655 [Thermoanaerobaculia bacterium]
MPVFSFAQLNSLVARVDQPRGSVPAECEQALSPAPPLRVAVRELELPREEPLEAPAPPTGALRNALQETQIALTRNDRPAFNAALSRTKALLLTYPNGAERRTAEDIVRLHETAARLWDTQYEAPFFSETDSEYALLRDLPGYTDAVRRNTLTDDKDRRFYPAAESRDFVAQVAGERLQRLGIHRTTRPVREARVTEQRVERPRPRRRSTTSTPTSKPAAVTRAAPAPHVSKPAAPPPAVAKAPAPAPVPVPVQTASTPTPTPAPPPAPETGTMTTTTAAPAPTASTADTAVTSTDVVPAAPPTSPGRSVFLPAVLILIGLGVLIVLFRASK